MQVQKINNNQDVNFGAKSSLNTKKALPLLVAAGSAIAAGSLTSCVGEIYTNSTRSELENLRNDSIYWEGYLEALNNDVALIDYSKYDINEEVVKNSSETKSKIKTLELQRASESFEKVKNDMAECRKEIEDAPSKEFWHTIKLVGAALVVGVLGVIGSIVNKIVLR